MGGATRYRAERVASQLLVWHTPARTRAHIRAPSVDKPSGEKDEENTPVLCRSDLEHASANGYGNVHSVERELRLSDWGHRFARRPNGNGKDQFGNAGFHCSYAGTGSVADRKPG